MNVPREFRQLYEDWERRVLERGAAKGRAEGLLAVLEARGWTIPPDVTARVRACHDADQLDTWLRRAATANSLADVFADH